MGATAGASVSHLLRAVDVRDGITSSVTLERGQRLDLLADAVTLVYVVSGSLTQRPHDVQTCRVAVSSASDPVPVTDGIALSMHEGDALLNLGATQMTIIADRSASVRVAHVSLSDSRLRGRMPASIAVSGFAIAEPAITALATEMGVPESPIREGASLICRTMTTTVLLAMIRAWAELADDGAWRPKDPFLDRVVDAIHLNPGREWTLDELARIGAMSRSVFAERFHRVLGSSPAAYVTHVRMDAAQRMLGEGRSVTDTSRRLGYASDEGFSRAFRRVVGVTPSGWRAGSR